jgi:hypothetical protein
MKRGSVGSVALAALLLAAPGIAHAQLTSTPPAAQQSPAGAPQAAAPAALPPGFGPGEQAPENPLRRFEIVSLGSFPIMLFYTEFGADLGLFVSRGFDKAYAPWPFKGVASYSPGQSEKIARLGAAFGLCLVIGAIDAVIHASKTKHRRSTALEAQSPAAAEPPAAAPAPPGQAPDGAPNAPPAAPPGASPGLAPTP